MSKYVDANEAAKSYRPKAGSMSPGLKRAREPYRVKNAILGIALGAFAVGVWAYSISAVKQDVFDDLDDEVEALGSTGASAGVNGANAGTSGPSGVLGTGKGNEKFVITPTKTVAATPSSPKLTKPSAVLNEVAKGVIPRWEHRLPGWLLDPERKTLIWGAPPVDNIGKMRSKSS